ncbi:MAG: DUF2344 domain-containing protein [Clostridia bacterium]|nr:DUF2344 domain-containing protein [Clostridia bacterium]
MPVSEIFRLSYSRGDAVKFVSHLDFVKVFERAIRRACVDVAFSNGFNPRMQLVFGNPLPVGFTSDAEFVDITLATPAEGEEIASKIGGELPAGITVNGFQALEKPYKSILASYSRSLYRVALASPDEEFRLKLKDAYENSASLVTLKKSKSSEKEVDIKPMIFQFEFDESGDLILKTASGPEGNLRPELAINTVAAAGGIDVRIVHVHKSAVE